MKITAQLEHRPNDLQFKVSTGGKEQLLPIAARPSGGVSVNGGELLFSALAACCCNDLYREAAKRGMNLHWVRVEVNGEFGAEGEPGSDIRYSVSLSSDSSAEEERGLIDFVDRIAEIHKTVRLGTAVSLEQP